MSESRQPYNAEPEFAFPETQVSCFSAMEPAEIKISEPTPVLGDAGPAASQDDAHKTVNSSDKTVGEKKIGGPDNSQEDTQKEAIVLDKTAEEKEVCGPTEVSKGESISVADEKQVYIPGETKADDAPPPYEKEVAEREVYAEKEVFGNGSWGDGGGKVFVPNAEDRFNQTQLQDMSQKEIYVEGAHQLRYDEETSPSQDNTLQQTPSAESGEGKTKQKSSMLQRKLDSMNQAMNEAVDRRKMALAMFTSESNTRLRGGYAQFERRVTDSGVAIEQGTSDRYKRLEQGIANHMNRVEQGSSARYAMMEKVLNDRADRAGKNFGNRVANLKQGVENLKKLGSRVPGIENGRKQSE